MIPDFLHNISLAFLNWDSQQGRDLATSGHNKKNRTGQSYYNIMRKVWYHQILILTYLGFIVLILNCMVYEIHFEFCKQLCKLQNSIIYNPTIEPTMSTRTSAVHKHSVKFSLNFPSYKHVPFWSIFLERNNYK